MLKRIILPTVCVVLAYGFWFSPNFKEIAAGVSIFLFGMLFLEEGFKAFTGGLLERLLRSTTDRLWKSIGFGIVTTTVMQSSSLVSVITISFLSAGLLSLTAGVGIIFGANIGTTTGAWLIAAFGLKVKIAAYAMPMLVFGIILVFQQAKSLKGVGYILAGLGFLFLGIHHMKEGFEAFRDTIDLAAFAVEGYLGLFLYAGIGVAATVIMQSSHATLVLIITALSVGQITYENALALAIGANIGTTITAIIGAMSSNYQGKRLAAAHLIFNTVTAVVAIGLISQFVWAVDTISAFVGIADDDYTMKLAVFHTCFNIVGVALMIPLINVMVRKLEGLIQADEIELVKPQHLNDAVMEFPETMLEAVRMEVLHLYDQALEIIAHGLNLHRTQLHSETDLEHIVNDKKGVIDVDIDAVYLAKVKFLYAEIIAFISRAQTEMPPEFADNLYELRQAAGKIVQTVKDVKHIRKNIVGYTISDNDEIRGEYNKIRLQLGMLLRDLHELREETGDLHGHALALDAYKIFIDEDNIIVTGQMDHLIREQLITAAMATSLMNDLTYARNMVWNLTEFGETLYGAKDMEDHAAEVLLSLDDDEIQEIRARAE